MATRSRPMYGTVFKVTLDGTLTTIFTFTYDPVTFANNGFNPEAALVQGTDGNLYGTTLNGGTHPTTSNGGTIFKMSTTGALLVSTTLNASGGEPANPRAPLIQGSDGNFYGTSPVGGNTQTDNGGAVFRCTPGGVVTVLHAFSDPEGRDPEGGVVQGSDGNFYGTTEAGGSANFGVVYRVTPAGGFTVLHTFTGTAAPDGSGGQPFGEMILARDGNFYGTTRGGGAFSIGTIFKLTPAGVLTTVYNFPNEGTTGAQPQGTLLEGSDGNFYGTTPGGNASGARHGVSAQHQPERRPGKNAREHLDPPAYRDRRQCLDRRIYYYRYQPKESDRARDWAVAPARGRFG